MGKLILGRIWMPAFLCLPFISKDFVFLVLLMFTQAKSDMLKEKGTIGKQRDFFWNGWKCWTCFFWTIYLCYFDFKSFPSFGSQGVEDKGEILIYLFLKVVADSLTPNFAKKNFLPNSPMKEIVVVLHLTSLTKT